MPERPSRRSDDGAVRLSLILPVCGGDAWIAENVAAVAAALEPLPGGFELLVVCDGDDDLASETAARATLADSRVRVLHYPVNQGKGFAIVLGAAQARGELIGWLDADLDIAPEVILRAVACFDDATTGAAIGSKRHPASSVRYPVIRRVYSWGYQMLVRVLFRLDVRDTQVGAKVLRREMLTTVAPLLLVKRWAFDLEVLAVGAEFGFDRIVEVPVQLAGRFSGTSINWRAVRNMLLDTLAVGYRLHVRHWYARRFAEVQRAHRRHRRRWDDHVDHLERGSRPDGEGRPERLASAR